MFFQARPAVQRLNEQTVERMIAMRPLMGPAQGLTAVVADAVHLELRGLRPAALGTTPCHRGRLITLIRTPHSMYCAASWPPCG
jgi:hypothetical protein